MDETGLVDYLSALKEWVVNKRDLPSRVENGDFFSVSDLLVLSEYETRKS